MTILASSLVWHVVSALLWSVLPVTVQTSAGDSIKGDLNAISDTALVIQQGGKETQIPINELLSLQPSETPDATGPTYRVTLASGSRIAAQEVTTSGNELVIEPRRQPVLRVPIRDVKAIRFRASSPGTDAQWLGVLKSEGTGDSLVIRRPESVLDPQRGIVTGITKDHVIFDLSGDEIKAPLDRLEGIVFGNVTDTSAKAAIQVSDVYGSKWSVMKMDSSQGDQPLQLRLTSSIAHELPLHHIESIRWSTGSMALTTMEVASTNFQPYFQTKLNPELAKSFFSPQSADEANLILYGGSSIEYRVEPGYETLTGSVARSSAIKDASQVKVWIELDGKVVWEQGLLGAAPLGFELPLNNARRLAIHVSSGKDGDLGDTVQISNARVVK